MGGEAENEKQNPTKWAENENEKQNPMFL